jgi:hypothetical protein
MATITKSGKGYRVQVCVNRIRASASFSTKREAVSWAAAKEYALEDNAHSTPETKRDRHTLNEALRKFADEISPSRRGEKFEIARLTLLATVCEAARRE